MTEETAKVRAVRWVGDVLTAVEVDLRDAIRQYDEAPEREEAVWPFELARRNVDAGFLVRLVVLEAVGPTGRPLACLEVASKCAALREPVWGAAEPADLELVASAMASEVMEARRLAWKAEDLMGQAEGRLREVVGELETADAHLDEQRNALADGRATVDVLRERVRELEAENDAIKSDLDRATDTIAEQAKAGLADSKALDLLRADLDVERAANARQAEGLRRADEARAVLARAVCATQPVHLNDLADRAAAEIERMARQCGQARAQLFTALHCGTEDLSTPVDELAVRTHERLRAADEARGWLREALGREETASLGDLAGQACGLLRDRPVREVLTGAAVLRTLKVGERVLVEALVDRVDVRDDTWPLHVKMGEGLDWISGEARVSRLPSEG
jgi:hypothetical protein